jgi:threonine dehydrogenase-like Zn-dependent dehydrogenase
MTIASRTFPATARAALWGEQNALLVEEVPVREPGPGQILVRVRACGICGSDLHRFHTDIPVPSRPGIGPGHEIAGVVAALGKGVDGPAAGTPVVMEPGFSCDRCNDCRRGRWSLCSKKQIMGFSVPGGMADYVLAGDGHVFPIPADLPFTLATVTEPLAINLRGLRRAGLAQSQHIFVIGAGAIGLLAVLLARNAGASRIGVAARYPHQRAAALALGATDVYDPDELTPRSSATRAGWDIVVESVGGNAPTVQQALDLAIAGGTVLVLGVHQAPVTIATVRIWRDEVNLIGSFGYTRTGSRPDYEDAVEIVSRYRDEIAALVTNVYPLDRVADAFAAALDKGRGAIKVVVTT